MPKTKSKKPAAKADKKLDLEALSKTVSDAVDARGPTAELTDEEAARLGYGEHTRVDPEVEKAYWKLRAAELSKQKAAAYLDGFMAKCAEHGINPEELVKLADRRENLGALIGGATAAPISALAATGMWGGLTDREVGGGLSAYKRRRLPLLSPTGVPQYKPISKIRQGRKLLNRMKGLTGTIRPAYSRRASTVAKSLASSRGKLGLALLLALATGASGIAGGAGLGKAIAGEGPTKW